MGLRETISNLSPNEFLAKMQDMMNMYMESSTSKLGSLTDYMETDHAEYVWSILNGSPLKSMLSNDYYIQYRINNSRERVDFFAVPIHQVNNDKIINDIIIVFDEHIGSLINVFQKNYKDNEPSDNAAFLSNLFNEFNRLESYMKERKGKENTSAINLLKNKDYKSKLISLTKKLHLENDERIRTWMKR